MIADGTKLAHCRDGNACKVKKNKIKKIVEMIANGTKLAHGRNGYACMGNRLKWLEKADGTKLAMSRDKKKLNETGAAVAISTDEANHHSEFLHKRATTDAYTLLKSFILLAISYVILPTNSDRC